MEIVPFQSFGVLRFGDTREEARRKLASGFETFRKISGATETDAFDKLGLHLYYSEAGHLEFVEAFEPADITFRGIHFLGRELDSVVLDMGLLGFSATGSNAGMRFDDAGIALYAPQDRVEAVSAYLDGYYDR